MIGWKRKVSGPIVYVRVLAMPITRFVPKLQEMNRKRCSGVKGNLRNASQSFICKCCKVDRSITDGLSTDLHLDTGNLTLLEKVDKYCYLGDMLDTVGGCDSAVTASVRPAWKKFPEYLPILTGKGFS